MGNGCIDAHFLTSALVGGERWASRPCRSTPGERAPGTHGIWGWVDPRASLDVMEKRKFLTLPGLELWPLCRPASSQSLCRPSHSYPFSKTLRMKPTSCLWSTIKAKPLRRILSQGDLTVPLACIGLRQKPFRLFSATHIDVDAAANSWNSSQDDRRSWESKNRANAEALLFVSWEMNFSTLAPSSLPLRP
jgi:hypothetical protein